MRPLFMLSCCIPQQATLLLLFRIVLRLMLPCYCGNWLKVSVDNDFLHVVDPDYCNVFFQNLHRLTEPRYHYDV